MTNIKFAKIKQNGYLAQSMLVQGHAGYAEHGKDIVCAAVSAITCALICFVENNVKKYSVTVKENEGYARVTVYEYDEKTDAAFEMAKNGMVQIEMAYPRHVTVSLEKN